MASVRSRAWVKFLYAVTIFCSAFLLFQIEPIITKLILPWFGGAAAVWSVCLLFFQAVLFLGYVYAHLLTRWVELRWQRWVHIGLIVCSFLALPVLPPSWLKPSGVEDPGTRVLMLLGVSIGLPYFLLSATSPLLQAWQSRSRPGVAPYRLYAVSNLGSLLGLLSYPIIVEPRVSNHDQAIGWSVAYASVVLLCAAIIFQTDIAERVSQLSDAEPAPDWKRKLLWAALAACTSMLLLSITSHLSQNIAAVPLIWILPLSLYLLTFIICFGVHSWYQRGFFLRLLAVFLAGMAFALSPSHVNLPPQVTIPLFCAGLFACCMVCHGELAQLKPHPAYLTTYYLLISAGGVIGAIFVALVAPRVFSGYYELPIALGVCGALIHVVLSSGRGATRYLSRRTLALMAALVVAFCVSLYVSTERKASHVRVMVRNFYGVLQVEDRVGFAAVDGAASDAKTMSVDSRYRDLINGTIEHGIQFLAAERRREATTYYGPSSGVGMAISAAQRRGPITVGTIGLGTGTLAVYGRPEDQYRFYEINPQVVELANSEFSFLRQSPAKVNVEIGDGRLSLEREATRDFDVLAVDAFTSDAIPTHLLTREAFALYVRHLKPSGLIAVHVSNKYLNLVPVVGAAAASVNRQAVVVESTADNSRGIYRATWVLVGDGQKSLREPELSSVPRVAASKKDLWTDDYSSIFKSFR